MNIKKCSLHILAALSLVGFAASQAAAAPSTCESSRRPHQQDSLTMSCKSTLGVATSGLANAQVQSGVKTVKANVSSGFQMIARGHNEAGTILCQAIDRVVDGVAVSKACSANVVEWSAVVFFD
jgi:hypothetical protein